MSQAVVTPESAPPRTGPSWRHEADDRGACPQAWATSLLSHAPAAHFGPIHPMYPLWFPYPYHRNTSCLPPGVAMSFPRDPMCKAPNARPGKHEVLVYSGFFCLSVEGNSGNAMRW